MDSQACHPYNSTRGRGRGRGRPAPAFRKKQKTPVIPNGQPAPPKAKMPEEDWAHGPRTRRGVRGRGCTQQTDLHSDHPAADASVPNGKSAEPATKPDDTTTSNSKLNGNAKPEEKKEEKKQARKKKVAAAFTASSDPNFSWFADPNDPSVGNLADHVPPVVQSYAPSPAFPQVSFADEKITGLDLSRLKLIFEPQDRARKGFLNTSISCYMNVVLQALLACPPFYNLLLQLAKIVAPQPSLRVSSSSFIKCFAELGRYFDAETQNVYGVYQRAVVEAESIFSSVVGKFNMNFEQEDCQEFLCYLLDGLHKEFLAISKETPKKEAIAATEQNSDEGSDDEWTEMGDRGKVIKHNNDETGNMEKSFVTDIFGGLFKSELTAHGKAHVTATYEPFYLLSLDIVDVENVSRAFDNFFKEEELNGTKPANNAA